MKDLDITSHRIKVAAGLDAGIACEELDELTREFQEVIPSKVCEMLASPMIFLSQCCP